MGLREGFEGSKGVVKYGVFFLPESVSIWARAFEVPTIVTFSGF